MFSKEQSKKSADKAPDKPKDKPEKEAADPRKKSNALEICLEGVRQLSDMLQEFTDLIPATGLNPALKTLSTIIQAIQDAKDNKEALTDDLLPRIERIRDQIVKPLIDRGNAAEEAARSVGSRLGIALDKIGEKVDEMGKQGRAVRFFYHRVNKDDIQKFGKQLDGILSEFTLEKINQLAATGQEQLDITKDTHKMILAEAQQKLIDDLPHVAAAYDSKTTEDKPHCAPETQKAILNDIQNWAESLNEHRVYWLCGLAGTGKSTICRTIAAWLDSDSRSLLGASYFFSRDDTNLANADSLFPTLAYQLSLYNPDFGRAVAMVLSKKRDAATKNLVSQCQALLAKPLETTETDRLSPIIVVIDAVDECSLGTDTAARLLAPLIDAIRSSQAPIRLLVSSRPEPEIVQLFDSLDSEGVYKSLNMHEIDVQSDIRVYLQSQFDEMRRLKPKLSHNWITAKDIDKLAAYAIPLFAVAAIMVNFAKKPRKDPRQQVKILLDQSSSAKHLPYSRLDSLYLKVVASAYREDGDDDEDRNRLTILLSTIVTLQVPMSPSTLAAFLSVGDEDAVLICLQSVSSVLIIPESADGTVRIFHESFRDFITDASRCTDSFYSVREDETQRHLALRCLHILNTELRPDICDLGAAPYANADIPDLNDRLAKCLPQHVRYSCLYVSDHVVLAKDDDGRIARAIEAFCSEKLLMWIEVLGLSQQVHLLLSSLETMGEWYKKHSTSTPRVANILRDAFHVVSRFREAIETSTGDIYSPLLALMPSGEMKATYLTLPSAHTIRGLPGMGDDWGSYRWVDQLDPEPRNVVHHLVFSPDGRFLAAIHTTPTGGQCRVWNANSGAAINEDGEPLAFLTISETPLSRQRHGAPVMAFSPDSASLVFADVWDMMVWICPLTGSKDRTLMVDTGKNETGNANTILLTAFVGGHDESLLVVTRSGHINVWNTDPDASDSPRRIFAPTASDDIVTLAAASEDARQLAIVRNDIILDLWDIPSGHRREEILRLNHHSDVDEEIVERNQGGKKICQLLYLAGGTHLTVHCQTELYDPYWKTLNRVKIFEVDTGNCLKSTRLDDAGRWLRYIASAGGRLSLWYGDDQIHMYTEDYTSYTALVVPEDVHHAGGSFVRPTRVAFSADGLLLAVGNNAVLSVHDVSSLKEKHTESSSNRTTYHLSHGPDGTLYDVEATRPWRETGHVTVHVKKPDTGHDTSYCFRLEEYIKEYEHGTSLQGSFWMENNSRTLLMTDLRTGQPCFGFSVHDTTFEIQHKSPDFAVSADGRWMAIRLYIPGSWERDGDGEVWVHDLRNGSFVAVPWMSGPSCINHIQLAVDGRSLLAVGYPHLDHAIVQYAVWELDSSNPLHATRKCLQVINESQRLEKRTLEVVGFMNGGFHGKHRGWYARDDYYVWIVIDPDDLSTKSYVIRGGSFLHSTPGKSLPRFLIVRSNRIAIQVGEVVRQLTCIPPEWSVGIGGTSSWNGSELAFRTWGKSLIRINTDELEESLYGSRLE